MEDKIKEFESQNNTYRYTCSLNEKVRKDKYERISRGTNPPTIENLWGFVYLSQEQIDALGVLSEMTLEERKAQLRELKKHEYAGEDGRMLFLRRTGHRGISSTVLDHDF